MSQEEAGAEWKVDKYAGMLEMLVTKNVEAVQKEQVMQLLEVYKQPNRKNLS